jgi:hypothetical protein
METAEEAITFFQSQGYPAALVDHPVPGSVRVAGWEQRIPATDAYQGEEIRLLQHVFVLFPEKAYWVVRDCNWLADIDESFGSLEQAVAAVTAHFAEWRASGRKTVGPGLTRRSTEG